MFFPLDYLILRNASTKQAWLGIGCCEQKLVMTTLVLTSYKQVAKKTHFFMTGHSSTLRLWFYAVWQGR